MGSGASSSSKYETLTISDLGEKEKIEFGRALQRFVKAHGEHSVGAELKTCNEFAEILQQVRNEGDHPAVGQITRQPSVKRGHRSSFQIVKDAKKEKSKFSGTTEESHESSISVSVSNISPNQYMEALRMGTVKQQSFKDPTGFRARRGSFSQGVVEDPSNREVFEDRRTTIYASSEIGITQEYVPPFPATIMGTFSCHGIAPAEEVEGDDLMKSLMGGTGDNKGQVHQKTNQDRGCVVYPFASNKRAALFMVLDGHGDQGDRVAEFAMRQIVLSVEEHDALATDPITALKESFIATNKALVVTKEIKAMTSGTTVVAAYVKENKMFIANVGDSRAVVATPSESNPEMCVAKLLSVDHKPDAPEEHARITKHRGYVSMSRSNESFVSAETTPNGTIQLNDTPVEYTKKSSGPSCSASARVWLNKEHTLVGLAMSRSIGDLAVKRVGVIAEPDVCEYEIGEKDKFLILASDGVWEFIENQEAVNLVNRNIRYGAHTACQMLIEEAEKRWKIEEGDYRDDITAIVVMLPIPYRP